MDKLIAQLSYFVAFAVVNDRNNVISMIEKTNVKILPTISNEDLIDVVFNLMYTNSQFKNEFTTYIKTKFNENLDNSFKNTHGDTTSGSSFWGGFNASAITGLVSTGLGFLSSSQAGKDARAVAATNAKNNLALATANLESNKTQLEIAKLQLEAQKLQPGTNNTLLYVVLGIVGLVVVVGTVLIVKKQNNGK